MSKAVPLRRARKKLAGAYIVEHKHIALSAIAQAEGRTLAGELRFLFDAVLEGRFVIKPKASTRRVAA